MTTNTAYGYTEQLEQYRLNNNLTGYGVGRVIAEHKSRYVLQADGTEYSAEIIGNLRYSADSRADLPVVGDWVAFIDAEDNQALIYQVFPRQSTLERQQVGDDGERQIIATNVDTALIVASANRDFNINRVQRYLTICNASNINAMVILNKVDLVTEAEASQLLADVTQRLPEVLVLPYSNINQHGNTELHAVLEKGKTYCLLGSSGVGKSTLLNNLMGKDIMQTGEISAYAERGKHVTTHRELRITPNGIIVIDNPGMREIGVTDGGLEQTFDQIEQLANQCKFNDCSHTQEVGCAVQNAIATGELSQETFDNYMKMRREQAHFNSSSLEKRRKYKKLTKHIRKTAISKRSDRNREQI